MKTNKLITNNLSVKKKLLTSQFVFSCKSYEQGEKVNRVVSREYLLTS